MPSARQPQGHLQWESSSGVAPPVLQPGCGGSRIAQPGGPAARAARPSALPKAGCPQALLRHHFEKRFLLSVRTGHTSGNYQTHPPFTSHTSQLQSSLVSATASLEHTVLWWWVKQFHEHPQNWHYPLSPPARHFHR